MNRELRRRAMAARLAGREGLAHEIEMQAGWDELAGEAAPVPPRPRVGPSDAGHRPRVRWMLEPIVERDRLKANPTRDVRVPSGGSRRERFATPEEARSLIAAVDENDRALWATAFYAGLRRGELQALRDDHVDLAAGEIHVVSGWDAVAGEQETQGRERRVVPIVPELRTHLAAHRLRTGRRGRDLVFGRTATEPFVPMAVNRRADAAWKAAGLKRITPHECRHTFASIAIAAGVNIGTVSAALGHASVTITWDRYHHLMPGTMEQAGELIPGLHRQTHRQRLAVDPNPRPHSGSMRSSSSRVASFTFSSPRRER